MRVILDIPEEILERLGDLAKFQKRSRKAFMEYVLITHSEGAEDGYPEDHLAGHKEVKGVDEQIMEEIEKKQATKLPIDKKSKAAPKPPISSSDDPMPIKQEGEDALDFAARKSEWKKRQHK